MVLVTNESKSDFCCTKVFFFSCCDFFCFVHANYRPRQALGQLSSMLWRILHTPAVYGQRSQFVLPPAEWRWILKLCLCVLLRYTLCPRKKQTSILYITLTHSNTYCSTINTKNIHLTCSVLLLLLAKLNGGFIILHHIIKTAHVHRTCRKACKVCSFPHTTAFILSGEFEGNSCLLVCLSVFPPLAPECTDKF